jgi:hypothetical protein
VAVFLGVATRSEAAGAEARNAARQSITADELKQIVAALADDTFEGREAGSRGSRAASGYIVDRLKRCGVQGGAEKSGYFQPFGAYRNTLGLIAGSDPVLKDEYIVVGAHYDHVGYGTSRNSYGPIGHIHNGADDNASGVAALLEVIDAVCQLPERPKRSLLFAFWDGEEKGLLGSQHWVGEPTVPTAEVALAFNLDMVGRLRDSRLEVYGVRTSPGLRRIVSRQNDPPGLQLDFNWDVRPDSDHQSFFSRSIPFLMLHTGKHPDYHRPSDDAEKINTEGLAQISQLMFNVLVELADAPSLGKFRAASRSESQGTQQLRSRGLALPAARLGVRWDDRAAEEMGEIVVDRVTPGSPAAGAGIQVGDRFVRFAGREVNGATDFRLRVFAAKSPATATLERPGADEPVEVTLQLAGAPVRLGISWRTDDAEPGVVIVNRVIPGSPADMAGVRINDRIDRIAGQEFTDGDQFRELALTAGSPLVLEVETAGRVRALDVTLAQEGDDATTEDTGQPSQPTN